ncbi:hypothetical protein [Bartonella apis]|nr:hypothetical protein [Bartonella apis]MBI0177630.1 hypothetical protein [Bartonella apis]
MKQKAEANYNHVIVVNFLALKRDQISLYDRLILNLPFDRKCGINHVM